MNQIKIKNKSGKIVAVMQWESPSDLIAWAESVKDNKVMEFSGAEAITLASDAPPPKRSAPASNIKLKTHADIIAIIEYNVNDLNIVRASLQKDFEYILSKDFTSEAVLNKKREQINDLDRAIEYQLAISSAVKRLEEKQLKTEYCLMNYGVSEFEFNLFMSRSKHEIEIQLLENRQDGMVFVPEHLRESFSNVVEPKYEPGYSNKPAIGIEKLREMAQNNPGILKRR